MDGWMDGWMDVYVCMCVYIGAPRPGVFSLIQGEAIDKLKGPDPVFDGIGRAVDTSRGKDAGCVGGGAGDAYDGRGRGVAEAGDGLAPAVAVDEDLAGAAEGEEGACGGSAHEVGGGGGDEDGVEAGGVGGAVGEVDAVAEGVGDDGGDEAAGDEGLACGRGVGQVGRRRRRRCEPG